MQSGVAFSRTYRETQGQTERFLILLEKTRFAHNDWGFLEWGETSRLSLEFPSCPPSFPPARNLRYDAGNMPEFSTEFWVGTAFAAIALLAGLAVAIVMVESTKGEFRFVIFCFLSSAVLVVYGIGVWEVSVTWPRRPRMIAGTLAFALVAMLTSEIIRWAYGRHLRAAAVAHEPKEQPSSPQPPPSTEAKKTGNSENPSPPSAKLKPTIKPKHAAIAPPGFISFVGQVLNGWAPMMQENQTSEPLDDVELSVTQMVMKNPTDPGPYSTEWQKQIKIGTVRALLTKGLDERFYIGNHDYLQFHILILTRFGTYTEAILMSKENDERYTAKLSFRKGSEASYTRTVTVGIVNDPKLPSPPPRGG